VEEVTEGISHHKGTKNTEVVITFFFRTVGRVGPALFPNQQLSVRTVESINLASVFFVRLW
jgi:hypothetical protein